MERLGIAGEQLELPGADDLSGGSVQISGERFNDRELSDIAAGIDGDGEHHAAGNSRAPSAFEIRGQVPVEILVHADHITLLAAHLDAARIGFKTGAFLRKA